MGRELRSKEAQWAESRPEPARDRPPPVDERPAESEAGGLAAFRGLVLAAALAALFWLVLALVAL